MDIKILVAAHKRYWMPADDVYMPLHVGAEGKEPLGYTPDNTGDNISAKNPNYCELTGLYWAWKNLDCQYIGLCHYRRYFGRRVHTKDIEKKKRAIFHREDYEKLLQKYDVILPVKRNYYIETVRSQYEHAHYKRIWTRSKNYCRKISGVFRRLYQGDASEKAAYTEYVCYEKVAFR